MNRSWGLVFVGLACLPAFAAAACGGSGNGSGGGAQGGGGGVAGSFPSSSSTSSSTGGLGGATSTGGGMAQGGSTLASGGGGQGGGGAAANGGGGMGGAPNQCTDNMKDGNETDVDCGGGTCPACALGKDCIVGTDCSSGHCIGGTCQAPPSCTDGVKDGSETGVDCGGGMCPQCGTGVGCLLGTDCMSGVCTGGFCVAPTCTDGVKNGNETGVDCGGTVCPKCPDGQGCASGTDCTSTFCVGGVCVACMGDGDCSGPTNDCEHPACNNNACTTDFTMIGTPVTMQTPGDCHTVVCDGMGGTTNAIDDTDVPNDNNACTTDTCTAGVPSNPPAAVGTACSQGGSICDGAGACFDLRVMVVRVGDGTTALSSTSAPVFLEEWPFSGAETRTITLPIAASSTNQPITLAGNGTTEGGLSLSGDGHYVTVAGYATAPGTATVASTTATAVNRVVARVDAMGNIDTSTKLGNSAFSGGAVRGAASNDGGEFWVTGTGTGGVWYDLLSGTTPLQISTTTTNTRCANIFAGQLFGSASSMTFTNVFTVGTGEPTTTGQAMTSLPGMLTAGASPYGFALLDLNSAVMGLDTLYVSEDNAIGNGVSAGGVHRWTFNGVTWTQTALFNGGLTSGVRGVAAQVVGNYVVVIAATAENPSRLVAFIDDGIITSATAIVIATSPTNELYRGVALSPR